MPLNHEAAQRVRQREANRVRKPQAARLAQPLPQGTIDRGRRYPLSLRVQCLTLLSLGFDAKFVQDQCGVPARTQKNIWKKAQSRGFDPTVDKRILDWYVQDGSRSGRPKEISAQVEANLIANVQACRAGREKSSEVLAYEASISTTSALNVLHKYGFNSVKPTRKPSLNLTQKAARL